MKNRILAIVGSASKNSSNLKLVNRLTELTSDDLAFEIFDALSELPHFNPEQSLKNPPKEIAAIRQKIADADGILISTPEYVFSIPSGLKNLIEWCVATTVFSHKPLAIVTASADGTKGHEELKMIMKTVEANFSERTTLLIQGIKGKMDERGVFKNAKTEDELKALSKEYIELVKNVMK